MRTEVINIIKSLKDEPGDSWKLNKYLAVLENNYRVMEITNKDKLFVKRILHIFFPSNPEYMSEDACLDKQRGRDDLSKEYTYVCKQCGENIKITGHDFNHGVAGIVIKCPACKYNVGCESPFSFSKTNPQKFPLDIPAKTELS